MNIDSLLNAKSATNLIEHIAELSLSHDDDPANYPKYLGALTKAVKAVDIEFDKESYAENFNHAADDAHWFATSLISNSEREGDGATRLWSMAACCEDKEEQEQIKKHAVDESRHSIMYLGMLDYTFPSAVEPEFRKELEEKLSPHYSMKQDLFIVEGSPYARAPKVDDYIQMNIAEIRTALHHMMQRKALERYCPEENQERMLAISASLLRDELYHVGYTAKLIEKNCDETLDDLFLKRMNDFNDITKEEQSQKIYD